MPRATDYSQIYQIVIQASGEGPAKHGTIQALYRIASGDVALGQADRDREWEIQAAAEDTLRGLGDEASIFVEELERAREW